MKAPTGAAPRAVAAPLRRWPGRPWPEPRPAGALASAAGDATGSMVNAGRLGRCTVRTGWLATVRHRRGCCTLVLHRRDLTLKCQVADQRWPGRLLIKLTRSFQCLPGSSPAHFAQHQLRKAHKHRRKKSVIVADNCHDDGCGDYERTIRN